MGLRPVYGRDSCQVDARVPQLQADAGSTDWPDVEATGESVYDATEASEHPASARTE